MNAAPSLWAIVPAAGVGRRMGGTLPKQFLKLGNKTVLEHSLEALCSIRGLCGVVLVSDEGEYLESLSEHFQGPELRRVAGGRERCHSVLNGLQSLTQELEPDDWVLVHDAARPCVRYDDLRVLTETLVSHPVGGLLGVPVRDTMKRADERARIRATIDRTGLWHAQTPQMFRIALLKDCMEQALADGYEVTDEASAIEHGGYHPLLVEGHSDNLKITHPEDLPLAGFFLQQQGRWVACE